MTLPTELLDSLWDQWKHMKEMCAEDMGPSGSLGLRWMLDFGRDFEQWPFYTKERAVEKGFGDIDAGEADALLAVFDTDNDPMQFVTIAAELLTVFGPPQWGGFMADAYSTKIPADDKEAFVARPRYHGDLKDDFEKNADSKVSECLTLNVIGYDDDFLFRLASFHYGEGGELTWDDEAEDDTPPAAGMLIGFMRRIIELHGKEPYDILVMLANGDEDEVKRMLEKDPLPKKDE